MLVIFLCVVKTLQIIIQPLAIWLCFFEHIVDIFRHQQFTGLGIYRQHLTRFQSSLFNHIFRLIVVHAYFRSQRNMTVFGNDITGWTQTITIQGTCRITTISDNYTRWTIPWFHMHGIKIIECLEVSIHSGIVLPSRWDQ